MLEELFRREGAASIANVPEIFKWLQGETIVGAFKQEGHRTTYWRIVFASGASLCVASNGSYWVDSKNVTMQYLELEAEKVEELVRYSQELKDMLVKLKVSK